MWPNKLNLAFLDTPIYPLERISKEVGKQIFIKRDDLTGVEFSGNKIRKLEFAVKEALDEGAKTLITCGGIQSNHARATAAVAAKLGLQCHLVLRSEPNPPWAGNYFLDQLFGAQVTFLDEKAFESHLQVMETLKESYDKKGQKAYLIPIGASNGIGNFGYANAFEEILRQETKEMDFGAIVCAVGSGGTLAGLLLGNHIQKGQKHIIGINVANDAAYFEKQVDVILGESHSYLQLPYEKAHFHIDIRDGYVGQGYAKITEREPAFISEVAKKEGLLLDPVYTGKAFYGLLKEIEKGAIQEDKILFIHTGGLYGLFPWASQFEKGVLK